MALSQTWVPGNTSASDRVYLYPADSDFIEIGALEISALIDV